LTEAVEDCNHVEADLSVDEMWAWLPLNWREPEFMRSLGMEVKESVGRHVGEAVKVSVGAAPNRYLVERYHRLPPRLSHGAVFGSMPVSGNIDEEILARCEGPRGQFSPEDSFKPRGRG
jgi:hypothetical protein